MFVLVLLILHLQSSFATDWNIGTNCESPQYLSSGKHGTVNCAFGDSILGVYWYNSTDYQNTLPFLYYTNNKKSGPGFSSNEFDIYPNGSLIINNVSFQHNHNFTVVMFRTRAEPTIPNYITVIVTVRPFGQEYPIIEACGIERICSRRIEELTKLSCYVNKSIPPVDIDFFIQTKTRDIPLLTTKYTDNVTQMQQNTVILRLPIPTRNAINVVTCKAAEPPKLLTYHESLIILTSDWDSSLQIQPSKEFIEVNSKLELFCTNEATTYIVWKKRVEDGSFINLIEFVSSENDYVFSSLEKYSVNDNRTSLTIQHITVSNEGLYMCISGDGVTERVQSFNISVYVPPDPPYLILEGCNNHKYCTLTVEETGQLTCILNGIRPRVSMEWGYVDPKESAISHTIQSDILVSKMRGETFDIFRTITYDFSSITQDRVTLECKARSFDGEFQIQLSTKLNLVIVKDTYEERKQRNQLAIVMPIVISAILLIVGFFAIGFIWLKRRRGQHGEIGSEMHTPNTPTLEKQDVEKTEQRAVLKKLLMNTYKEMCEAVRLPIPGSSKKFRVVDTFVEGEIVRLNLNSKGQETWQKISTHHDIFENTKGNNTRIILEGEAGIGKTLLCLKMAHDWYSGNKLSPLENVDFFIFIHMRFLGRNVTLYEAIKQHLLPSDCKISIETIEQILSSDSSVVIALNSYNRYPLRNEYEATFIKTLMMKKVLATARVIITTIPTCLPPTYANLTKRMRMVGFDENAQNEYFRKVVVNDDEELERIKHLFQQIPGVYAVCQVPLFFALLANLMHTGKLSPNDVSADTATKLFECILKALKENIKSELDSRIPDEKDKLISNDTEYPLYLVSFESLGKVQGLLWEKTRIEKDLGNQLYSMLMRLGILIEEEVFETISKECITNSACMNYHKKVRFYHGVFCQWYAAHHLATLAEKSNPKDLANILANITPMEYSYVYLFACGLNDKAAENIIKYVESIQDGKYFAQLCIFERKGKGIQAIQNVVEKLCSTPVRISKDDSLLAQRSITQLLKLAADNKISIEGVEIMQLGPYFNSSKEALTFNSGISLIKLETLTQLSIYEPKTKFSDDEFNGILKYAMFCSIESLRFHECILPKHVDKSILSELNDSPVSVEWTLSTSGCLWYKLNLELGQWEKTLHISPGRRDSR